MEFRILGPIEVVDDAGQTVPLGGARQRALLAALLLHANEVVLLDRLMEELWGERPPATGAKALQVAVSQLRKTLGDGLLQTRPSGYLLQLEPEQLDSTRFEALREQARAALGSGRPAEAASALREALGLWRGPALGDVAYEPFARAEAERLEELRLSALEERIEADLALGRTADLVAELEPLVARHPTRERPREHLMLALYRAGRQAEALDVYRETRRMLADELGIEPGPRLRELERAILRHDPALQSPAAAAPALPAARALRAGRRHVVLAALGVVAVGIGTYALLRDEPTLTSVAPNSVAVIDPGRNALVDELPVGESPRDIAAGAGAVWVRNQNSNTFSKIDPRSREVVQTFGAPGPRTHRFAPVRGGLILAGLPAAQLTFVVPENLGNVTGIPLDPPAFVHDLASAQEEIWVATDAAEVLRVRGFAVGPTIGRIALDQAAIALAVDGDFVWVAHADGTLALVDVVSRSVTATVRIGRGPTDVAVGAGAVWLANGREGTVTRVRPRPVVVEKTIRVGRGPSAIAIGAGGVWVVNRSDGTVSRIDPRTNRVVATIRVGERPEGVAVAGGLVWVSVREK